MNQNIKNSIIYNVYPTSFYDSNGDGIGDYYAIDDKFGTMEDLQDLIKEAHKLGLKVLLDLVVGHTSDQHKWFKESAKAERNEYWDYYVWSDDVFGYCPYKHMSGNSD